MAVNPVQVQKFLGGIEYPTSKDRLLDRANQKGADQSVRETLERLPDTVFSSSNDVSEAIGDLDG